MPSSKSQLVFINNSFMVLSPIGTESFSINPLNGEDEETAKQRARAEAIALKQQIDMMF